MTEIPELTAKDLARAMPARVRKRLMLGQIESGGSGVESGLCFSLPAGFAQ